MLHVLHNVRTLLTGCFLLACVQITPAQPLDEQALREVEASLKELQGFESLAVPPNLPADLSRAESEKTLSQLWSLYKQTIRDAALGEVPPDVPELLRKAQEQGGIRASSIAIGEHSFPYIALRRNGGEDAPTKRPLFFCTHGGGANPKVPGPHAWPVNSREWQTQIQLAARIYPSEGVYFVPRMADDRLGRWYHAHNHDLFERVIRHGIAHWNVDPNRVYLIGISEGGYGTAIVAPFMPDRFGGANAMAAGVGLGNPAENLQNLAFRTDVGEHDNGFDRSKLAAAFHEQLDLLHGQHPADYKHSINIQAGRGHGIDYRPGVQWITQHKRDPWPERLTWLSKEIDGRRRSRHFWIEVEGPPEEGFDFRIKAEADAQANTITVDAEQLNIEGDGGNPTHVAAGEVVERRSLTGVTLRVLLHDDLIDLDQPVTVRINGEEVFRGKASRDTATLFRTLHQYGDPEMAAYATLEFDLNE